MPRIRPRPFFLVAANRRALQLPVDYLSITTPRGGTFRLLYLLPAFPRTVLAGAQTSPELRFRVVDTRGVSMVNQPIQMADFTTPAGFSRLRRAQPFWVDYEPGEIITVEVSGQVPGPIPATVSVTLLGQRGWEEI